MMISQKVAKTKQPSNYREVDQLIERCEVRMTPFDVRILQTFKQPHFALKRIKTIVIHLALSGARLTTFTNTKFVFRVRNKGRLYK